MATIRKRQSGKWQVIIRKKNYPSVVRSFLEKSTATKFAKDVETQMDKQIFQDLTRASTTTLKELMIKYRDEIVPTQKAMANDLNISAGKVNKLIKEIEKEKPPFAK